MKMQTNLNTERRRWIAPVAALGLTLLCAPSALAQRPEAQSGSATGRPQQASSQQSRPQAGAQETRGSRTGAQEARGTQEARGAEAGSQSGRTEQARTQQARTQQARTQQARTEQAASQADRAEQARTQQARTQQARTEQARSGDLPSRREYRMTQRERDLQERLEGVGVLPRRSAERPAEPLRLRLEQAGALPRTRINAAQMREPARQPRSPQLRSFERMERGALMRAMFEDEGKHRVRLGQLDRLEALANSSGDLARMEQIRSLREVELARHQRLMQRGDEQLGGQGTFRSIVDSIESRPASR